MMSEAGSTPLDQKKPTRGFWRFAKAAAKAVLVTVAVCGQLWTIAGGWLTWGLFQGLVCGASGLLIGGLVYWGFRRIMGTHWLVGAASAIVSAVIAVMAVVLVVHAVAPAHMTRLDRIVLSLHLLIDKMVTAVVAMVFGAGAGQR